MERLLSKETEEMSYTEKHCLLNCITLLRNVLHIPDNSSESSTPSNSNRYIVKKSKLSPEKESNLKYFFSDKTDSATTESRGSMIGEATSGSGENAIEDDEGSDESTGEMKKASDKENGSPASNASRQHQVLWNLFAHNLDSVIMSMIESPNLKTW